MEIDNNAQTTATKVTPKKETAQSRAQKRWIERTNQEAQATINSLMTQFLAYFMESPDPEGEAVQNKRKDISAKWRLYCKHKQLGPQVFTMADKYMDQVLADYLKEKDGITVADVEKTSRD